MIDAGAIGRGLRPRPPRPRSCKAAPASRATRFACQAITATAATKIELTSSKGCATPHQHLQFDLRLVGLRRLRSQ